LQNRSLCIEDFISFFKTRQTKKQPLTSGSQVRSRFYAYADIFLFGNKSQFNDLCLQAAAEVKKIRPNVKLLYVRAEYTPMKVALVTPIKISTEQNSLTTMPYPRRKL